MPLPDPDDLYHRIAPHLVHSLRGTMSTQYLASFRLSDDPRSLVRFRQTAQRLNWLRKLGYLECARVRAGLVFGGAFIQPQPRFKVSWYLNHPAGWPGPKQDGVPCP